MAQRRRHHKAEALSIEAQRLIEEGLAGQATYEQIAERVEQATGERISTSALHRYHDTKVRPRVEMAKSAAILAQQILAANGDFNDQETRRAIYIGATQALMPVLQQLATDKPADAARFYTDLEARRLEERKLEQRNAELELRAQALEQAKKLAEARLSQIAKALQQADEKKGKRGATKAELEQTLRDLYGIVRAPAEGEA